MPLVNPVNIVVVSVPDTSIIILLLLVTLYIIIEDPPFWYKTPEIIIKELLNETIETVPLPIPKEDKKPVNNQKKTLYFIDKITKMNMKLF